MRMRGHDPRVERAVASYSRLGEHAACWLALGAAGALRSTEPARRRAWLRGAESVAVAYAGNYAVKLVVSRERPELPGLPPLTPVVSALSFPSAHATTSFAAARAYPEAGAGTAALRGSDIVRGESASTWACTTRATCSPAPCWARVSPEVLECAAP